jgi:hypothetical protein
MVVTICYGLRTRYENVTLELEASRKADRMREETAVLRNGKSKQFFNFVKSKTKENPPIPTLLMPGIDAEYQTPAAKSEAFSDFFASVFSTDNGIPMNFGIRTQNKMNRVVFTEQKVLAAIKNSNSSFAAGPDGLHSFFLKRVSHQIARPLALIFNMSMETGKLPKLWLEAQIVPTPKSRKRHLVSEYRPMFKNHGGGYQTRCHILFDTKRSVIASTAWFYEKEIDLYSAA